MWHLIPLYVKESKPVLDFEFHTVDSGFQAFVNEIPDSKPRIPYSTSKISPDSGTRISLHGAISYCSLPSVHPGTFHCLKQTLQLSQFET